MPKTIFITGTGTGVGKTLLTALLLHHLRRQKQNALALKPFCSGGRDDARLLLSLQKGAIELDAVNPFYFPKPLAPWVASTGKKRPVGPAIGAQQIRQAIASARKRCDTLLIEGSGGIYVPLNPRLFVVDLIAQVADSVIVVAPNALGTINHTLLTLEALKARGLRSISVVFMDQEQPDPSAASNPSTLAHFVPGTPIYVLPHLGKKASTAPQVKRLAPTFETTFADLLGKS